MIISQLCKNILLNNQYNHLENIIDNNRCIIKNINNYIMRINDDEYETILLNKIIKIKKYNKKIQNIIDDMYIKYNII